MALAQNRVTDVAKCFLCKRIYAGTNNASGDHICVDCWDDARGRVRGRGRGCGNRWNSPGAISACERAEALWLDIEIHGSDDHLEGNPLDFGNN